MPEAASQLLYENGLLAGVTGGPLRPGSLELTGRLVELAGLSAGERILDVGCGSGATLRYLSDVSRLRAFGIDRSRALLGTIPAGLEGPPLACASGLQLPVASGCLDIVLSECSLSAMGEVNGALAEFQRILRPGGRLLLSDIYAREPKGIPSLRELPLRCGLRYAATREDRLQQVRDHGFRILAWEDHSTSLKSLGSQVTRAHGSLSGFWGSAEPEADPMDVIIATRRARLGYFLLVAVKTGHG